MRFLESEVLRLAVAPERGEIRSLVHRRSGEELLFRSPWEPSRAPPGPPGAEAWVAAWPGGWTLLFPNAGNRCALDGREHGFHGAASLAAWSVVDASATAVTLAWTDASGLAVRRTVALDGAEVTVATEIENRAPEPRPYVLVEHLILGAALAGPGARVTAGPAAVLRMDDDGGPLGPPEAWPTAGDWTVVPDAPFSRFGALHDLERREVRVARGDLAVALRWSGLPCLWLWHEHRASAGFPLPITALGLEPASVAGSTGLAQAVADGTASWLGPGVRATATAVLAVS